MNGAGVGRLLLLTALVAGCAPQDAQTPAPPDKSSPAAAEEELDLTIPETAQAIFSTTSAPDTAQVAEALRGLQFARESSVVWEVAHEARQQDVRDTERTYDEKRGEMIETPRNGTTNPSKVKQNEEWQRKAAAHARRDALLLTETHRRFRELFAEKLKLPELPTERLPLRVTVLWNRESFNSALAHAGSPVSPRTREVWLPGTGELVTYASDESLQSLDEVVSAGDRVQKINDQALATAASAQLLREYAAARRGEDARTSRTPTVEISPHWLFAGVSEFLGGVEVGRDRLETLEGADWGHERIVLRHVSASRNGRDEAEKWTIAELLRVDAHDANRMGNVVQRGERLAPGRGASMADLFTARSWTFCHFLWNYDGAKYRDRLVAFVGRALDGTATSDVFAKEIMGRPDANDWGDVEMEFEWYWNRVIARKVGRDRKSKEWYQPPTEPPTEPPQGTVADDAEFRAMWAETHPAPKDRPK